MILGMQLTDLLALKDPQQIIDLPLTFKVCFHVMLLSSGVIV